MGQAQRAGRGREHPPHRDHTTIVFATFQGLDQHPISLRADHRIVHPVVLLAHYLPIEGQGILASSLHLRDHPFAIRCEDGLPDHVKGLVPGNPVHANGPPVLVLYDRCQPLPIRAENRVGHGIAKGFAPGLSVHRQGPPPELGRNHRSGPAPIRAKDGLPQLTKDSSPEGLSVTRQDPARLCLYRGQDTAVLRMKTGLPDASVDALPGLPVHGEGIDGVFQPDFRCYLLSILAEGKAPHIQEVPVPGLAIHRNRPDAFQEPEDVTLCEFLDLGGARSPSAIWAQHIVPDLKECGFPGLSIQANPVSFIPFDLGSDDLSALAKLKIPHILESLFPRNPVDQCRPFVVGHRYSREPIVWRKLNRIHLFVGLVPRASIHTAGETPLFILDDGRDLLPVVADDLIVDVCMVLFPLAQIGHKLLTDFPIPILLFTHLEPSHI